MTRVYLLLWSWLTVFLKFSAPAETLKSQARKPKCSKGYHCSRNAYMLVYKVQDETHSDPSGAVVEVPCE